MVRTIASVLLVLAALTCVPARAQSDPVVLYARALRWFNPNLGAEQSTRLAQCVLQQADNQGLDARLLVALVAVESEWHRHAVSQAGAMGLGQLMPGTAADLGVDPEDPQENIAGAARYLRSLLDHYAGHDSFTRYVYAIAAYNAGPGAVDRYGGVPPYPQTEHYVTAVVGLWRRLAGER